MSGSDVQAYSVRVTLDIVTQLVYSEHQLISAFVTSVTDDLFTTTIVPPAALTMSSWNKFVYRDGQKRLVLDCVNR